VLISDGLLIVMLIDEMEIGITRLSGLGMVCLSGGRKWKVCSFLL
jgi:hypothetical protein